MNTAIIVAAGLGTRLNLGYNKLFYKIIDREIIKYTLDAFYNHSLIDQIILSINQEDEFYIQEHVLPIYPTLKYVYGGLTRQISVKNALAVTDSTSNIVLIHDGARPFISNDLITDIIKLTELKQAAIVAKLVSDTIKIVNDNTILKTLDRRQIYLAQTPQAFKYDLIMKAHEIVKDNVTDDASMVEKFHEVSILVNDSNNIKITTREDLDYAEYLIKRRKL